MRKLICSVQQGKVARALFPGLEAALKSCYAEHFGARPAVMMIWIEVPQGQGYTEGRLSDVSWIMVEVEDGLAQSRREAAMLALAAQWARVAGVATDRIVLTLCDSAVLSQYLAANRQRLRPLSRIGYLVKTLTALWSSRRRHGFLSMPANL